MEASTKEQIFGPAGQKGVDVGLPRSLILLSPEGSCEVFVGTRGGLDEVAWFEVYVGARAVGRMCGGKGEGGISRGHGGFFSFSFSFFDVIFVVWGLCGMGGGWFGGFVLMGMVFLGSLGNVFVIVKTGS